MPFVEIWVLGTASRMQFTQRSRARLKCPLVNAPDASN